MSENESKIVIPLEGTTEITPHVSIEVLIEASKQIDEQLKKNAGFKTTLQKTFSEVQTQLNQIAMNENMLNAQKACTEEYRRKIVELLNKPVDV